MMSLTSILGLDHFILMVTDLDRAQANYEALGFKLTPRGFHVQRPSQNHTTIFGDNYLELLYYPPDIRATSRFNTMPLDYEGPIAVALRPTNSEDVHAELEAMGLQPAPLVTGGRPVETPDGPKRASWRNQVFPDDWPSLPPTFCCGHEVPELVYIKGAEVHPNGARRIAQILLVHSDPTSLKPMYAKLFGEPAVTEESGALTVTIGTIVWRIISPAQLALRFPGMTDLPSIPDRGQFVGIVLNVASLASVKDILGKAGIGLTASAEGGLVPSRDAACGLILEFREG
jgi:catechol 2,3-dioxygenase-like lactoylglutathione lyase family enzyme